MGQQRLVHRGFHSAHHTVQQYFHGALHVLPGRGTRLQINQAEKTNIFCSSKISRVLKQIHTVLIHTLTSLRCKCALPSISDLPVSLGEFSRFVLADDALVFKIAFIAAEDYVRIVAICVGLHVYIHVNMTYIKFLMNMIFRQRS